MFEQNRTCPHCGERRSIGDLVTAGEDPRWRCRHCHAQLRWNMRPMTRQFNMLTAGSFAVIALGLLIYPLSVFLITPVTISIAIYMQLNSYRIVYEDRPPGCPNCRYNLQGTLERPVCPECGATVHHVTMGFYTPEAQAAPSSQQPAAEHA